MPVGFIDRSHRDLGHLSSSADDDDALSKNFPERVVQNDLAHTGYTTEVREDRIGVVPSFYLDVRPRKSLIRSAGQNLLLDRGDVRIVFSTYRTDISEDTFLVVGYETDCVMGHHKNRMR